MVKNEFKRRNGDMNFLKNNQVFISLISVFMILVAFVYSTFATIKYVDDKHEVVMSKFDDLKNEIKDVKIEMKETNNILSDLPNQNFNMIKQYLDKNNKN